MGQSDTQSNVSEGMPWWVWGAALAATAAVVIGIVAGRQEVSAEQLFDEALQAGAALDGQEQFEKILEELRRRGSEQERVALLEGIHAVRSTRYPRGVKLLEPFLEHENERFRLMALEHSGNAHLSMGNSIAAVEIQKKLSEASPSELRPLLAMARIYQQAGNVQATLETAEKILEIDPEHQPTLLRIAVARRELGEEDAAIDDFQELLANPESQARMTMDIARPFLDLLQRMGRDEEALELTRTVPALRNPITLLELNLACGHIEEAQEMLDELKKDSESMFNKVAIILDHPEEWWLKGLREIESEEWERAVESFRKIIISKPRTFAVLRTLQTVAARAGDTEMVEATDAYLDELSQEWQERYAAVRAIGNDMTNVELRLRVAEYARQLTDKRGFGMWTTAARSVAGDQRLKDLGFNPEFTVDLELLVPLPLPRAVQAAVDAAKTAAEKPAAEKPAAEDSAAEDSAATDPAEADDAESQSDAAVESEPDSDSKDSSATE